MEKDTSQKCSVLVRPKICSSEAQKIVHDVYGLIVINITALNGYDDKNFHILVDDGVDNNKFIDKVVDCGYVLKIINTLDSQDESALEAQTELLLYLNENDIKCPKPILTKYQKSFHKIQLSSGEHVVRLLEYISGEILFKITGSPRLFYEVGVLTAKLDNVLQTFDHPAYHKNIQWCLRSAPDILNYLHAVKDPKRQHLVKNVIEEFSLRVLSVEDQLDKGIIHGDINEQNLIVEKVNNHEQIKAIIDLGDTHYACYLYELAIAMTYMIFTSNDIGCGECVLSGYCKNRKITDQELKLLRICILTRFCQSLVLGAYASLQQPDNKYVVITAEKGWDLLDTMSKMSEDVLYHRWESIISVEERNNK